MMSPGIFTAGASYGAVIDVYLKAGVAAKTINGVPITMWGFALCDSAYNCGAPATPGPALSAAEGDTLNIHLKNNLNGLYKEPVSIVIPGQITAMIPTWNDGTTGNRPAGNTTLKVRSFTAETPANGTTEVIYTWNNVKAGTYLYESGTHPAVQVQMGLYGSLKVIPAIGGQAYNDPLTAFNSEVTLLFSEIDPALHKAVETNTYGPGKPVASTIDYNPEYFLINGVPYTANLAPIPAGLPGQKLLIRFLNAGLQTKVPTLQNYYTTVIAEDGNLLPYSKEQYSVFLPAGKTMDVIIPTTSAGYITLYDRALNLTNKAVSPGGMLKYLEVASPIKYALTVNRAGTGAGTVEVTSAPGGISCGTGCTSVVRSYNENTVLQLASSPAIGATFGGWSGVCAGTAATCVVTMDSAKAVTATFNTTAPTITVNVPNGGESWKTGTVKTIKWSYTGNAGPFVAIQLYKGGTFYSLITRSVSIGANGTGSYNWYIPARLAVGTNYMIKITSLSNSAYTDLSNNFFTLTR